MEMAGFEDQGRGVIGNNAYTAPSRVASADLEPLGMCELPIDVISRFDANDLGINDLQGMEMAGFEDQGRGVICNNAYAAPSRVASADLEPLGKCELPTDVFSVFGENTPADELAINDLQGIEMEGFEDQGRGLIGNNAYATPSRVRSADLEPLGMRELPKDVFSLFGEDTPANQTNRNYFPHYEAVHSDAVRLSDLFCQQQELSFESSPQSADVNFNGGMPTSVPSTLEERPTSLFSQVLGRGIPCNSNEAVKVDQVHIQPRINNTSEEKVVPSNVFNSLSPHSSDSHSHSLIVNFPLPPQSTQRSESYVNCYKEPTAKRPKTLCCYTMEHVIKKIGNYESSSASEKAPDEKQQQQQDSSPNRLSMDPHVVQARKRRNEFREKISCLEKLIPLDSELKTCKLLEVTSEYVKFLQDQVHLLECMPSSPSPSSHDSKEDLSLPRTLNPTTNNMMSLPSSSSVSSLNIAGRMKGSLNVNVNSLTQKTSSESLSAQEMFEALVTSRRIQGKLFRERKFVVGTEQNAGRFTGSNK